MITENTAIALVFDVDENKYWVDKNAFYCAQFDHKW
jgi:hypothetical protein